MFTPHSVEKYYKKRSCSKYFCEINSFITSLVKTLIWRKKVHFSVKIVIAFYGNFIPHCAPQCENYRIYMPLIFYVKSHQRICCKNSVKSTTQCGNSNIFLSLRFNVQSLLEFLEVHKMPFFVVLESLNIHNIKIQDYYLEMSKWQFFELAESLKLISRKIWVAANFCNIHTPLLHKEILQFAEKIPSNCHTMWKLVHFSCNSDFTWNQSQKITLTVWKSTIKRDHVQTFSVKTLIWRKKCQFFVKIMIVFCPTL